MRRVRDSRRRFDDGITLRRRDRVCRTLNWPGFPQTGKEFEGYTSFRTHSLGVLLRISGQEVKITETHFLQWNALLLWSPEARYRAIGSVTDTEAQAMITAAEALLAVI